MAKRLGISFGGGTLRAVVLDSSRRSAKIVAAVEVPLTGTHGAPEDGARLAEELRKSGFPAPPAAVVSLPAGWTFLRRVSLPVADLGRAKRIHGQEFEGNLPVEGEKVLSDLLPAAKGDPKRFLAAAALERTVRGARAILEGAGIPVARVVTDHVSCYGAFLSLKGGISGHLFLAVPDILLLETAHDALLRARHLPATALEDRELLAAEWSAFLDAPEGVLPAAWHSGASPGPAMRGTWSPLPLPGGLAPSWTPAFGASLLPSYDRETGGFALGGGEDSLSEAETRRRRLRHAVIAAAAAFLFLSGALASSLYSSGKRLSLARVALAKEFQSAVPGGKVTAGEVLQARGRLQSLEKQWKELGGDLADPVATLSLLSRSLPPGTGVRVRELSLEGERLRVAGEARGSGEVEKFRSSLSATFGEGWRISVQESRGSVRGDTVSFTIVVEKGGGAVAG